MKNELETECKALWYAFFAINGNISGFGYTNDSIVVYCKKELRRTLQEVIINKSRFPVEFSIIGEITAH